MLLKGPGLEWSSHKATLQVFMGSQSGARLLDKLLEKN
jgi:hypothetical protein